MPADKRLWQCPGCSKTFRIPVHREDPGICPKCSLQSAHDSAVSPASAAQSQKPPSRVAKDDSSAKPSDASQTLSSLAVLVVVVSLLWVFGAFDGDDPDTDTATMSTAEPNTKRQPVSNVSAEEHPSGPSIPGLNPSQIYLNLEKKGFSRPRPEFRTVEIPTIGRIETVEWLCEQTNLDHALSVEIRGPDTLHVHSIDAMYTDFGSQGIDIAAQPFFAFVASIQYDGAQPAEAQRWVASNIGHNASTVIRQAKFELFANADQVRVLTITAAPN